MCPAAASTTGSGASLRHGPTSVPYSPMTPARSSPRVAARNDIRPPMQNPIVRMRSTPSARSAATAARMSAAMPAHVVRWTWGMYSKSASPRGDPGRPPEPVDGERVDAVLGEAQGELLVVGMEAADVGQDDDARPGRRRRVAPGTRRRPSRHRRSA